MYAVASAIIPDVADTLVGEAPALHQALQARQRIHTMMLFLSSEESLSEGLPLLRNFRLATHVDVCTPRTSELQQQAH